MIKGRGRFFVDDHASRGFPPPLRYQLVYNRKRKTNPDRSLQLATSANHRPLCRAARTQKKAGRKRSGGVGLGCFLKKSWQHGRLSLVLPVRPVSLEKLKKRVGITPLLGSVTALRFRRTLCTPVSTFLYQSSELRKFIFRSCIISLNNSKRRDIILRVKFTYFIYINYETAMINLFDKVFNQKKKKEEEY